MRLTRLISILLSLLSLLLLLVFLWWHWQLGLTRYFDVDEFAYLHWVHDMFLGKMPYRDFFSYVTPLFPLVLEPIFLFTSGTGPFLASRILAFIIFAALVGESVLLFWLTRRSWLALVAGAILAFLPLPFDKFLEVRPDTLATLVSLGAIIFQIFWLRTREGKYGFVSGLLYAVSLLILGKTLPTVIIASAAAFLWLTSECKFVGLTSKYLKLKSFILGLGLPLIIFFFWLVFNRALSVGVYSILVLPNEVNKISQVFFMAPDIFFYPNSIFYGVGGWSQGLLVNHFIWLVGLTVGIVRLLTPYLPHGKKGVWEELLLSGIFIAQVIFYVMIAPLKHSQYLIPIAVFVAFYTADGINFLWQKAKINVLSAAAFVLAALVVSGVLYDTFLLVNQPKLAWANAEMLSSMRALFAKIPKIEYILDLDGRTLYYKNPYYACCLPFGQYAPYLSRPLPSLPQALEATHTKYIYQGQLERVKTLMADDQTYIASHYRPLGGNTELLVRND